jgi:hypothetical protein
VSRNDGPLITGLSSAASRRLAEKQKEQAKERLLKATELQPYQELAMSEIKAERERIYKALADLPISYETTQDNVVAFLLAQKMHLKFLEDLETRYATSLRLYVQQKAKEAEEAPNE